MRASGATKSDPTHLKKGGSGGWGSSRDAIADGLDALENGDMPTRPPQQDVSVRKVSYTPVIRDACGLFGRASQLSFSSSTSSNESSKDGPNSPVERITEEDTALTEEPATASTSTATAKA